MTSAPFWTRLLLPRFDWLQIEVTSHCNAACRYCPHTLYRSHWQSRHLPPAVFHRLLPIFRKVNLVYLQGWGEPLLHPDFFTFAALARRAGCRVGTTSNATLVTDALAARLVEAGLEILAFSLAGIGAHHDLWRPGTSYDQVIRAIRLVDTHKRRLGRDTPRIHVAYLLLGSGLSDLAGLPTALSQLGISQVVISTLDLVAAPALADESLAALPVAARGALQKRFDDVKAAGAQHGLRIHVPTLPVPGRPPVCPEHILQAAVVSAAGDVSPCVYTNLPTAGGWHYVNGLALPIKSSRFGNILQRPFQEIWQSAKYRSFRRSWQQGQPPPICQDCLKIKQD